MDDTTPEQVKAKVAGVFNAAAEHFDRLGFWEQVGRGAVGLAHLQPGERVLDVCCGTGASALPAAEAVGPGGSVVGLDLATAQLEVASRAAASRGIDNVEFRVGDAEATGLAPESVDAVVCVFGLFFCPDMDAALREWLRVLAPGGRLVVTTWASTPLDPATSIFVETVRAERPDLFRPDQPPGWARCGGDTGLTALMEGAGASGVEVVREAREHHLVRPDDWWTVVLGSGFREVVDDLGPEAAERIRRSVAGRLDREGVERLTVDVWHGLGRRPDA